MTTSSLIRWSGLAAMAAGVLNVLDSIFEPLPWLTMFTTLATVFGLIGIYAIQAKASGWLGFAGYLLATAGYVFIAGTTGTIGSVPNYVVGISLSAVGLVLLAFGSLSAGVLPRWVPALWLAAIVIGFPSLVFPALERVLEIAGGTAIGLGLAGAGYVIWTSGAALAAARTSAAPG